VYKKKNCYFWCGKEKGETPVNKRNMTLYTIIPDVVYQKQKSLFVVWKRKKGNPRQQKKHDVYKKNHYFWCGKEKGENPVNKRNMTPYTIIPDVVYQKKIIISGVKKKKGKTPSTKET